MPDTAKNRGSIRVLEKCGFKVSGTAEVPSEDGKAIEEHVFILV